MSRVSVRLILDLKDPLKDVGQDVLKGYIHDAILRPNEYVEEITFEELREYLSVEEVAAAGGHARAEKLSAEERSAIASKAAKARWAKRKKRIRLTQAA